MEDKGRERKTRPSGRRTQHPTKGNKKGYNGRQRETRPSGRRTHHPTGKQEVQWETRRDKTLGKAETPPNNKGKPERAQWETKETRPWRTYHPTKGSKNG